MGTAYPSQNASLVRLERSRTATANPCVAAIVSTRPLLIDPGCAAASARTSTNAAVSAHTIRGNFCMFLNSQFSILNSYLFSISIK